MENKALCDLISQADEIHKNAGEIINKGGFSPILKNEFKNKISQYEKMYESVETMKTLTENDKALERLIDQQIEILKVRIDWEQDWIKKAKMGKL